MARAERGRFTPGVIVQAIDVFARDQIRKLAADSISRLLLTAKGALITATAAGTPATLPVGSDDEVLVADSGEATGLKWGLDAQTWTNPINTGITIGNGTLVANFVRAGQLVHAEFRFVLGSSSAITGDVQVILPVTAQTSAMVQGVGYVRDASVGTRLSLHIHSLGVTSALVRLMNVSGSYINIASGAAGLSSTVPFTWTTSDEINLTFDYLAA